MGVEARLVTYPGMPHGINQPRRNRQVMEDNLKWFNRFIWGEEEAETTEKTCYIVLPAEELTVQAEGNAEEILSTPIQDVYHWARRDRVDFRILSAENGLFANDSPRYSEKTHLLPENVSSMAIRIAAQVKEQGFRKLVLFTPEIKKNSFALIYLGCLQVSAGILGNVTVEYREIQDKGW
jgi:hypothetical protein